MERLIPAAAMRYPLHLRFRADHAVECGLLADNYRPMSMTSCGLRRCFEHDTYDWKVEAEAYLLDAHGLRMAEVPR